MFIFMFGVNGINALFVLGIALLDRYSEVCISMVYAIVCLLLT